MNSAGQQFHSDWLGGLERFGLLVKESFAALLTFKIARRDLMNHRYFISVKSQSVVLNTGAFTRMVRAFQAYFQFHKFKLDTATLALTGGRAYCNVAQ